MKDHSPLPWTQGTVPHGFNADTIHDADGSPVLYVSGVYQHRDLDELKDNPECRKGMERATFVLQAVNNQEAMKEALALAHRTMRQFWKPSTPKVVLQRRKALEKIEDALAKLAP